MLVLSCVVVVVPHGREEFSVVDHAFSGKFTRSKVFEAASRGDPGPLSGLQDFLKLHHLKLTSPEYIGKYGGGVSVCRIPRWRARAWWVVMSLATWAVFSYYIAFI